MPTTHLCSIATNSYPASVSKHIHNKHKYPPPQNILGAPPFSNPLLVFPFWEPLLFSNPLLIFPYFQTPTLSSALQLNLTQLSTPAHTKSSYFVKSVSIVQKYRTINHIFILKLLNTHNSAYITPTGKTEIHFFNVP